MKEALDDASGEDGEGDAQDEAITASSVPGGGGKEEETEGGRGGGEGRRAIRLGIFIARASAGVGKFVF